MLLPLNIHARVYQDSKGLCHDSVRTWDIISKGCEASDGIRTKIETIKKNNAKVISSKTKRYLEVIQIFKLCSKTELSLMNLQLNHHHLKTYRSLLSRKILCFELWWPTSNCDGYVTWAQIWPATYSSIYLLTDIIIDMWLKGEHGHTK